jgi:hypothetical protein
MMVGRTAVAASLGSAGLAVAADGFGGDWGAQLLLKTAAPGGMGARAAAESRVLLLCLATQPRVRRGAGVALAAAAADRLTEERAPGVAGGLRGRSPMWRAKTIFRITGPVIWGWGGVGVEVGSGGGGLAGFVGGLRVVVNSVSCPTSTRTTRVVLHSLAHLLNPVTRTPPRRRHLHSVEHVQPQRVAGRAGEERVGNVVGKGEVEAHEGHDGRGGGGSSVGRAGSSIMLGGGGGGGDKQVWVQRAQALEVWFGGCWVVGDKRGGRKVCK